MVDFTGGTWRSLIDGSEVGAIPDAQDLQAVYAIDDGSDLTVTDSEGNNDGTITGANWVSESELGQDSVLEFDDGSDRVESNLVVGGSSQVSCVILYRPNNLSDKRRELIGEWPESSSDRAYSIGQEEDGALAFRVNTESLHGSQVSNVLSENEWYMLGLTYDGDTVRGFVNKSEDLSGTPEQTGDLFAGGEFMIGNMDADTTRGSEGRVAQAYIWNTDIGQNGIESMADILLP